MLSEFIFDFFGNVFSELVAAKLGPFFMADLLMPRNSDAALMEKPSI